AKEMTREGFSLPLLIGGATTSVTHTAVKIAPAYTGPTIHVLDASRSVNVASSLISPAQKPKFLEQKKEDYEKIRAEHKERRSQARYLPIEEARENRLKSEWKQVPITKPSFLGLKAFDHFSLADISARIDWSPFFHTWELRGRYPAIFNDERIGKE